MHIKADVIYSRNMLIGKFVDSNWLRVVSCWPDAWERSAGAGEQWLLTILSWEKLDNVFCKGRYGERNY